MICLYEKQNSNSLCCFYWMLSALNLGINQTHTDAHAHTHWHNPTEKQGIKRHINRLAQCLFGHSVKIYLYKAFTHFSCQLIGHGNIVKNNDKTGVHVVSFGVSTKHCMPQWFMTDKTVLSFLKAVFLYLICCSTAAQQVIFNNCEIKRKR